MRTESRVLMLLMFPKGEREGGYNEANVRGTRCTRYLFFLWHAFFLLHSSSVDATLKSVELSEKKKGINCLLLAYAVLLST